jgi:hypothetical protein
MNAISSLPQEFEIESLFCCTLEWRSICRLRLIGLDLW